MCALNKIIIKLGLIYCLIYVTQGEELLELSCLNALQCQHYQHAGINATCIDNHCKCSNEAGERVECRPKNSKVNNIIGGPCPCKQPNSECDEAQDMCYCAPHYMPTKDKRRCLPVSVQLGDKCDLDIQCQASDNFAVCNPQTHLCHCKPNFELHHNRCVSILSNDIKCLNEWQCSNMDNQSMCAFETKKCICNQGFVAARGIVECLQVSDYQQRCSEDAECQWNLGPGSRCEKELCNCTVNYYPTRASNNRTVCAPIIELGHYCRTDDNCQENHINDTKEATLTCIYGECSCRFGYYSINDNMCNKNSGNLILKTNILFIGFIATLLSWNN